jgi:hypothetical protein
MKTLPDIANQTPKEIQEKLRALGLSQQDVEYLLSRVFNSTGFILVANVMDIGTDKDPDGAFMEFLNNFALFVERKRRAKLKGVAVLVTKMDKYPIPVDPSTFIKNNLRQVYTWLQRSGLVQNTRAFFSAIYGEYTVGKEQVKFQPRMKEGVTRIEYTVDTYKELVMWLRNTF